LEKADQRRVEMVINFKQPQIKWQN
jgi:hypothetical protein